MEEHRITTFLSRLHLLAVNSMYMSMETVSSLSFYRVFAIGSTVKRNLAVFFYEDEG